MTHTVRRPASVLGGPTTRVPSACWCIARSTLNVFRRGSKSRRRRANSSPRRRPHDADSKKHRLRRRCPPASGFRPGGVAEVSPPSGALGLRGPPPPHCRLRGRRFGAALRPIGEFQDALRAGPVGRIRPPGTGPSRSPPRRARQLRRRTDRTEVDPFSKIHCPSVVLDDRRGHEVGGLVDAVRPQPVHLVGVDPRVQPRRPRQGRPLLQVEPPRLVVAADGWKLGDPGDSAPSMQCYPADTTARCDGIRSPGSATASRESRLAGRAEHPRSVG